MGFPVKSYELFKHLGDSLQDKQHAYHSPVYDVLKKYSIQSFFIYDPVKDPDFAKILETDFMYFDRLTGRKMMFMCLLQGEYNHEGAQYRNYDFLDEKAWVGKNSASPVTDISLATQMLCNDLKLDYSFSPYLVFTTHFNNKWAYATELNKDNLEETMHALAGMASHLDIQLNKKDFDLEFSRRNPELMENSIELNYHWELSKILLYYLRNTDAEEYEKYVMKSMNKGEINLPIRKIPEYFLHKPSQIPNSYWVDQKEIFFQKAAGEFVLKAKSIRNYLNSRQERVSCSIRRSSTGGIKSNYQKRIYEDLVYKRGLEQESKNFIKIVALLSNNKFMPVELPDYSFFTINLAKFFEVELNLSIGQLIRLNDNIEMPVYFNRLKPDGSLHNYLPNNLGISEALRPIPLNKPKNRKHWQAPGLGETKLVWESMLKKKFAQNRNEFSKIYESSFLSSWGQ
nr:hypothetical protein [Sediminibacterium sp.]